jgi:hypothetical protein
LLARRSISNAPGRVGVRAAVHSGDGAHSHHDPGSVTAEGFVFCHGVGLLHVAIA